jgi:alkylation response protein AidB-like acyl-CoA dehydrogenase
MYYPLTSRQQLLLAQLDPLVERFAARAAEQDRMGLFPHQNFVELRAAGLPGMIVPGAFGGGDATLTDAVMAMERLAMGDGSTALAHGRCHSSRRSAGLR